jgi:hypothetical protein
MWLGGKPHFAQNMMLPDGSMGCAETVIHSNDIWRTPVGDQDAAWTRHVQQLDNSWVWGSLRIWPDRLEFTADRQPYPFEPQSFAGEACCAMAAALFASSSIREHIADFATAMALWSLLVARGWRSDNFSRDVTFSYGDAGSLLADIRGKGETFLDYEIYDFDPDNIQMRKPNLISDIEELGWRLVQ